MRRLWALAAVLGCGFCFPALASTIFVTGGSLNGQPLSSFQWMVDAEPGELIAGTVSIEVTTTGSSNAVMFPLGYTWTWGARETSIVPISNDVVLGESNWNVPISLVAPSAPGSYYLLFGVRGELTHAQVFSSTNWQTGTGQPVWHDANDYHDMDAADLLEAHENGVVVDWPILTASGYQPGGLGVAVAPIQINVIPEPETYLLLLAGLLLIGVRARMRNRGQSPNS